MNIGFKAVFLIDILNNIPSDEIRLELSDPSRAGLILPVDDKEENIDMLSLLMPMMLND
jgi:DNA polymerase-3 subunit beta